MSKNHIFSTNGKFESKYYSRKAQRKRRWESSSDKKGQNAHKRMKALINSMTSAQKEKFRDFYEGIRPDEKGGSYTEEDLDDLFAIGDAFFAGEDVEEFISTLDEKYGDLL